MLVFSIATFVVALAAHFVIWWIRLPRSHTTSLLKIFALTLAAALAVNRLLPLPAGWGPRTAWEHLLMITFHFSLALTYIIFYSAVEGDSPTCRIVASVADAGHRGLSRADLSGILDNERVVLSRVRAMVQQGLAREEGGLLRLTPAGLAFARLYFAVERIFGLKRGG